MRTIRVTGKGQLRLKPDITRITMTLEGVYPEYGETLRHSSEDTEALKDVLSGFGFARSDLKTLNFSVDTEYESYREREVYKQRFIGYRFQHMLKVEFSSDNERLGRILYALSNCAVSPEFRLSYTVSDPEAARNELLGKAVQDAKEKAASSAGSARPYSRAGSSRFSITVRVFTALRAWGITPIFSLRSRESARSFSIWFLYSS